MAKIGLRIDVDTFRGSRDGVPTLLRILSDFSIKATFFFSVGPDNMGRHLWRLVRPTFLRKMLRSRAASLYGWDILLRGVFFPGPVIGRKLGSVIKEAHCAGHEIGFHAWDHHAWQANVDSMSEEAVHSEISKGVKMLTEITGEKPSCSAVPGWKCTDAVLLAKERFGFSFNSDCRGKDVFMPVVSGKNLSQPQIPVTLPTYDELIGRDGVTNENYNERLLSFVRPEGLNVLTIHAEAEGIACETMFVSFLKQASDIGHSFVTLGSLLSDASSLSNGVVKKGVVDGREGWVAVQAL